VRPDIGIHPASAAFHRRMRVSAPLPVRQPPPRNGAPRGATPENYWMTRSTRRSLPSVMSGGTPTASTARSAPRRRRPPRRSWPRSGRPSRHGFGLILGAPTGWPGFTTTPTTTSSRVTSTARTCSCRARVRSSGSTSTRSGSSGASSPPARRTSRMPLARARPTRSPRPLWSRSGLA